jgi:5-methylcytosine-specific restriction protein A
LRNPKWAREEIVLALELYFHPNRGSISSTNPKIKVLSEELNSLKIHSDKPDEVRFRNENGCTLKLSNFQAIDPKYMGTGMQSFSKLDKSIFLEFSDDMQALKNAAALVRRNAGI